MRRRKRQSERRGFTLLLTLMMLVLLAGVIVQFQSDTMLQVRAGSYRIQQLQCQYAAESALIMATQVIREGIKQAQEKKPELRTETPAPPEELLDPNSVPPDPCSIVDPNQVDAYEEFLDPNMEEDIPTVLPSYVFDKKTIEVGEASVEIEVYDENSKFPLTWLVHSPIEKSTHFRTKSLPQLVGDLQVDSRGAKAVVSLAQKIGTAMKVPPPGGYLYQLTSRNRRYRGRTWRMKPSKRTIPKEANTTDFEKYYRNVVASFAREWWTELQKGEKYDYLLQPLEEQPGSMADYLGSWGHGRINLNSASPEVMVAAFGELGFTREMADEIVTYRENTPLKSTGELVRIKSVPRSMHYPLRMLTTASSDTYTVFVKARIGRAEYSLFGGLYKDRKGKLIQYGVLPGE